MGFLIIKYSNYPAINVKYSKEGDTYKITLPGTGLQFKDDCKSMPHGTHLLLVNKGFNDSMIATLFNVITTDKDGEHDGKVLGRDGEHDGKVLGRDGELYDEDEYDVEEDEEDDVEEDDIDE